VPNSERGNVNGAEAQEVRGLHRLLARIVGEYAACPLKCRKPAHFLGCDLHQRPHRLILPANHHAGRKGRARKTADGGLA
jgi:hypothetical protein